MRSGFLVFLAFLTFVPAFAASDGPRDAAGGPANISGIDDKGSSADQSPAIPASPPVLNQIKLGNVRFSGSLRLRLYDWDWFVPKSGNNEYLYSGNILRFGFSQQREWWDWKAEFAVPFLVALPNGASVSAPQGALGLGGNYSSANNGKHNTAMIFPKQLYVRFDRIGGSSANHLQIGRFEFLDGSEVIPKNATVATVKQERVVQRLIGNFGFSDVGRSFDGANYSYTRNASNLTFVAGIPTRGVFQVDGWGWNRTGFGYLGYTYSNGKAKHAGESRVFVIDYDDWRHIVKVDSRTTAIRQTDLANIHVQTWGAHTLQVFETNAGTVDALLWGAAQTGHWGYQTQRSGAIDAEAGFQPAIMKTLRPWLRGGFTWSSGDSNPNDKTHGTFFQIMPTPRPYARFPFFNMMNLEDRFGTLIVRPHRKFALSNEFHSLRLSTASDLWYSGGGVFQPWSFGYTGRPTAGARSLANLYDANIDYRLNPRVTATAYYGYAQGRAAMQGIYPKGKDGQFGFLELLYRF